MFDLAKFIKDKRAELGLSTRQLASMVGVTAPTICKWEKGQISHLKEDKVKSLAYALNVSPMVLFGYEDVSMKKYDEKENRIPLINAYAKTDLFTEKNVIKYIYTNKKADFATTAVKDVHGIKKNDILLFCKISPESIPHDSYVLVKSDNQVSEIAKSMIIGNQLYINNGITIEVLKQEEMLGIAVELRRDL